MHAQGGMALPSLADLKILVARVWGRDNLQAMDNDHFKRLREGGYTTPYLLEHATIEDLMAVGFSRALASAICQKILSKTCCQSFCLENFCLEKVLPASFRSNA